MAPAVGRERELEQVTSFLDPAGAAHLLVLEGEPGIGKTTVWEEATSAAVQEWRILGARPLQVEAGISFAGVGDLLSGSLDDVRAELPAPQLRALEVALMLAEAGTVPPEPQAIAFAFLSSLRALARSRPLLVAIDDFQWLDRPSTASLLYAARRIGDEPVRFLLARRSAPERDGDSLTRAMPAERLRRVSIGPLSRGALQRLLTERLDAVLPRPVLTRIHAASGGNPLYAIELARALPADLAARPGGDLRLPSSLAALVDERLSRLPPETEQPLQVAALLARPTVDLVGSVLGTLPALRTEAMAGVAEVDDAGRIRFAHPLLTAGLAGRIDPAESRGLHRRIAAIVAEPEERARHLAQAASGVDPEAAAALETAARQAHARGAPEVAAELLERALLLTSSDDPDHTERLLAAAEAQCDAGDFGRSRDLATQAIDTLPSGETRARALLALASASGDPTQISIQALAEAGSDHHLRARISMSLALGCLLKDLRRALDHARSAVEDAELAGDPVLTAETLAFLAWFEGACCEGDPFESLARASELEHAEPYEVVTGFRPAFAAATVRMWRDEHDLARAGFAEDFEAAVQNGHAFRRMHALLHLAQVEWRAGSWDRGLEQAEAAWTEWSDSGDAQGVGAVLWIRAVIAAHRGDLPTARNAVAEALSAAGDDRLHRSRHEWVLGFAALCEDDAERAVPHLEAASAGFAALSAVEPGMRLFASDLIEALLAVERVDDASREAEALVRLGRRLGRPRALAIGLRGTGLVLAARGELDPALARLAESLAVGDAFPVPFEHGRTLLALGAVQRRARRRRAARQTLEQAVDTFERLGAPIFAERARAELTRIGGRAPSRGGLTPTERRVADLVADGKTNREAAAELVLSVHTVEAALTSVYRKLGVRSRTELARTHPARAVKD
jgi:DNA-binding CsgD family transcriptional regulator